MSGNPFAQLAKLISNLETLGDKGVETVAAKLEPAVNQVLQSEYEAGKGPDGQGWAHKADGTLSHLQKTGAMRAGTQVVAGVKGISVRIPKPGGYHQGGTERMPARPLVPEGDQLPPDWERAAEAAATSVILDGLTK